MSSYGPDDTLEVLFDEITGYLEAESFTSELNEARDLRPRVAQLVIDDLLPDPSSPFERGLRIRLDEVASMGRFTEAVDGRRRVWIGGGGVVVCDRHAESFLRTSIERSPRALWHHTPRGHWVASHLPEFRCDACTDL